MTTKLDTIRALVKDVNRVWAGVVTITWHTNTSVTLLFREAYENDKIIRLPKQEAIDLLTENYRYYSSLSGIV